MRPLKKSLIMIFLLQILTFALFSQSESSVMFDLLEKKGYRPQSQQLASGTSNNLPYNIIVNFGSQNIKKQEKFIILFDLKQAWEQQAQILNLLAELKDKEFASQVVFCYGSNLNLDRDNIIYGSDIFARSLNSDENSHVFIFDLSQARNTIISGSNGHHSPSWMVKYMYDAYKAAKATDGLPVCYISQVADYSFSTSRLLLSFLENDIPCILGTIKDNNKLEILVKNLIFSFEKNDSRFDDSHTFMFRFFGKNIWLSELRIINSIIISVIIGFLLVFCIGFINKNIKREFWQEISTIWYALPVIYIFSYCGFFVGKALYNLFVKEGNSNYSVYGIFILQIGVSAFFVSSFFMLNLSLQKKYTTRSLDFLLVINSFINLVIFTLIDISLFPIFLLIFIVTIISLIFRRNWIHIILFVFLIIPFIPYINSLYNTSDKAMLHKLLIKSNTLPFLLSLVLLPVYLMWLRILNSLKKYYSKKRVYAAVILSTYILILTILALFNKIFYSKAKNQNLTISTVDLTDKQIFDFELSYSDKEVFDDTIRKININSSKQALYANVRVIGSNPVLYSENDYSFNNGIVHFLLPLNPPQKLEFNYGSEKGQQIITVEEIFYSTADQTYYSLTKSIIIEERK